MRAIRRLKHESPVWLLGICMLIAPLFISSNTVVESSLAKYKVTGDVFYGDKNKFSNPCVVERDKVFKKIPAYIKIKREGLDKSSARYFFLIKQANEAFTAAVKTKAEELKYDLVVEKDGIKAKKGVKIPDITKKVIKTFED